MRKHLRILGAGVLAASLVMAVAEPALAGAAAGDVLSPQQAIDRLGLTAGTTDNPAVTVNDRGESAIGALKITPLSAEKGRFSLMKSVGAKSVSDKLSGTVVQELESGVRYLTIIKNQKAATNYEYRFPGSALKKNADGSVTVTDSSGLIADIAPAWALDANMKSVATSYAVFGDRLVQHVDHNSKTAYPVVADPSVSLCRWGIFLAACIKYSRWETERAYSMIHFGAGVAAAPKFKAI